MTKYKVGDRVRVVCEKHGHKFDIGSVIEISEVDYGDHELLYASKDEDGDDWWLSDDEITPADKPAPEITVNGAVYILKPDPKHVWKFGDWARHPDFSVAAFVLSGVDEDGEVMLGIRDNWTYKPVTELTYISTAEIPA